MKNSERVHKMFIKQNELNIKTCGEDWRKGICEKTGKRISWNVALISEASELIDSLDLFHWKRKKKDLINAKIELADLVFFTLSKIIARTCYDCTKEGLPQIRVFEVNYGLGSGKEELSQIITNFLRLALSEDVEDLMSSILWLGGIGEKLGVDLEELYDLYMTKLWLNTFRVENGYAEGTYRKLLIIEGEEWEDNKVLMTYLEDYQTPEEAYAKFTHVYHKAK